MIVCWDAAHAVVGGRQHRDRLSRDVHAGEYAGRFRYARQPFMQHQWVQVIKMQVDVIFFRTDASPFTNFHRHGARDDVT